MAASVLPWVFFGLLALCWAVNILEGVMVDYLVRHRHREAPPRWPSFSIIKPLAGHDDDLEENLKTHLAIDYPGEWELLIGVKNEQDGAYPIARAFADQHPTRVRLCLQDGEPGLNPKVNQLITLTKQARYEVIALTDSNVRVRPNHLTEHAHFLARPRIALTSNGFVGSGEKSFGSRLDNLTLASFVLPNLATGDVMMRFQQIVAKSIAIKREALEAVGGWEAFKDVLAEDQRLGQALKRAGYRTALCNTPVHTVQSTQSFGWYWARHTRWAMIRFIVLPGVYLEPLLNPTVMALLFAAVTLAAAPASALAAWAPWLVLGSMVFSALTTHVFAIIGRGRGFSLASLLLVPLRDVIIFAMWLRGAFLREVVWRGNRLRVGRETRLSRREGSPESA